MYKDLNDCVTKLKKYYAMQYNENKTTKPYTQWLEELYFLNEAESSLEKARMLECELENILNTHIFSKQVSFEKDPSEYNRGRLDAINNCFEEYQKRMQELRRIWNERWGEDNVAQEK